MKYLISYKLFERKGNYQLFHKTDTSSLLKILKDGYIKSGFNSETPWDIAIRKNVISNWQKGKFKTISATRNFDYMGLPALELNVEKISDRYKIIPYSENPDFYLDFKDDKTKNSPYLTKYQKLIRSKKSNVGKMYWRVKTDKYAFDFGIAEELILADTLSVEKYVKRIILTKYDDRFNKQIIELIENKYPHIEVIEVDKHGKYLNVINKIKDKEKISSNY